MAGTPPPPPPVAYIERVTGLMHLSTYCRHEAKQEYEAWMRGEDYTFQTPETFEDGFVRSSSCSSPHRQSGHEGFAKVVTDLGMAMTNPADDYHSENFIRRILALNGFCRVSAANGARHIECLGGQHRVG